MRRWVACLSAFLVSLAVSWVMLDLRVAAPVPVGGAAGYSRQIPEEAGDAVIPPDEVVYGYVESDGTHRYGQPTVVISPAAGMAVRLNPGSQNIVVGDDGRVYVRVAMDPAWGKDPYEILALHDPSDGSRRRVIYRVPEQSGGARFELLGADPSGRWLVLLEHTPKQSDVAGPAMYWERWERLLTVDLAEGRVAAGAELGLRDNEGWIKSTVLWCTGRRDLSPCEGLPEPALGQIVAVSYDSPWWTSTEVQVVDLATGTVRAKAPIPVADACRRSELIQSSYSGGRVWQLCKNGYVGDSLREINLQSGAVVREIAPPGETWPLLEHPDGSRYYVARFENGITDVTAVDLERGRVERRRLVSLSPGRAARPVALLERVLGRVARAKGWDEMSMYLHPTLSPDGGHLLVPAQRTVRTGEGLREEGDGIWVLDARTLRPLRHDLAGRNVWGDVQFSPDGLRFYALEREGRKSVRLLALETATGRLLKEIPAAALGHPLNLVAAGRSGFPVAGLCAPERRLDQRQAGTAPELDLLPAPAALAVIRCPGLDGGLSVYRWREPVGLKEMFPPGSGVVSAFWSPDGLRLIIQRVAPDSAGSLAEPPGSRLRSELWFFDTVTDRLRQMTDWPEEHSLMEWVTEEGWSPRGDQVLVRAGKSSPDAGGLPLYLVSLVDGSVRELGTPLLDQQFAAWSPDGERLVVATGGGGNPWKDLRLRLFDAREGRLVDLSPEPGRADYHPVWSPDGSLIVHVGARTADGREPAAHGDLSERRIWLLDPATGRRQRLTDDQAYVDEYAAWSSSGRHIVFVRRLVEAGNRWPFEVWRMRPDGSEQEKLADANPERWYTIDYEEIRWREDVIDRVADLDLDPPERMRR